MDQFVDALFIPALEGNLDELSDARSLAASIKGGGGGRKTEESIEAEGEVGPFALVMEGDGDSETELEELSVSVDFFR